MCLCIVFLRFFSFVVRSTFNVFTRTSTHTHPYTSSFDALSLVSFFHTYILMMILFYPARTNRTKGRGDFVFIVVVLIIFVFFFIIFLCYLRFGFVLTSFWVDFFLFFCCCCFGVFTFFAKDFLFLLHLRLMDFGVILPPTLTLAYVYNTYINSHSTLCVNTNRPSPPPPANDS